MLHTASYTVPFVLHCPNTLSCLSLPIHSPNTYISSPPSLLSNLHRDLNPSLSHCSSLQGYLKKRAFIATQGPLPDTVADFWRMVWEYKCASIVMLTKEKEGSRVQCNHYWPDWMEMYGLIQVFLISENTYWGHIQREFKLINTKVG